jgi:hypothetical protein
LRVEPRAACRQLEEITARKFDSDCLIIVNDFQNAGKRGILFRAAAMRAEIHKITFDFIRRKRALALAAAVSVMMGHFLTFI